MVQSVSASSGITLQYEERGHASGVPVVFLHGLSDSWRSFESVLTHLPPSIRAIALTLRGHGGASRPEHGYEIADLATDVNACMQRLGLSSAVVVGHSMGSLVAQRLALDHPEKVAGLVLLGAFATLQGDAAVQELRQVADQTTSEYMDPHFVREFQESTLAHPIAPEQLDAMVEESMKVPTRVWRGLLRGLLAAPNCAEPLGDWAIPTLIVWGERDAFTNQQRQVQLRDWLGAQLVTYRWAGHAMHWEQPGRTARDILDFVYARRYEQSRQQRRSG